VTFALWLVVAAAVCHVAEEYLFPGGFLDAMRSTAPAVAFAVNVPMAVVINGLMFTVLVAAAALGSRAPVFALSGAALGAVNGWGHVAGTLRRRRYVPGALTGLMAYQPAAALAYLEFAWAGLLSPTVLVASLLLGAGYHAVPLGYLGTRWLARRVRPPSSWRVNRAGRTQGR